MSAWAKNTSDKLAATQSKGLSHQPLVVHKLDGASQRTNHHPLDKFQQKAIELYARAFLRRGRQTEENISRARTVVSPRFILIIPNGEKVLSDVNVVM